MIKIVKELGVEVTKPNIFQAIVAKQFDMNSRFLKVTFMDCGTRIDIPLTGTTKAIINAERKDGESKGFDGVINNDGTVTVPLHSWMLELDGTVICDISVIDTANNKEKKLTTTSFTLLVEKAAYGGEDVTSDPQYDVLLDLIEKVEDVESGKNFANSIKVNKNSTKITINDVSPIEHGLDVKLTGDDSDLSTVPISRYGKNLSRLNSIDLSNYVLDANGKPTITIDDRIVFEGEITGDFVLSCVVNAEKVYSPSGTLFEIYYTDRSGVEQDYLGTPITFEKGFAFSGTLKQIICRNWCSAYGGSYDNIQLEVGTVKTEFEEYKGVQTVTAKADGTVEGLVSVSPNMTLVTNTEGVIIDCTYNADTKMYIDNKFAELSAAILNS